MEQTLNLESFNPKKAELLKLAEEAKAVTVTDLGDKKQLAVVHEKRMALREARLAITNGGKQLRADAVKFQKDVIAREKELIAIIESDEERLEKIEDDAKRHELVMARRAKTPDRVARLEQVLPGIKVDAAYLETLDDVAFEVFFNKHVAEKNRMDGEAAAEERRKLDEERQKIEEEKAAAQRKIDEAAAEERRAVERREAEERQKKERADLEIRQKKELEEATERGRLQAEQAELKRKADAEAAEKQAAAKRDRDAKYQAWLKEIGATKEDVKAGNWFFRSADGDVVEAYKKAGVFKP